MWGEILASRLIRAKALLSALVTVTVISAFMAPVSVGATTVPTPRAKPAYTPPPPPVVPENGVLDLDDIDRYQQIFAAQKKGRWSEANGYIAALNNETLMGHVMFQRYMHPTAYRSKYSELRSWMGAYRDHPEANTIYRLAMRRKPGKAHSPLRAESRKWRTAPDNPALKAMPPKRKSSAKRRRISEIQRYVRSLLRQERPTQALNYVNSNRTRRDLTKHEYDQARQWISNSYYLENVDKKAYKVANDVATRNRVKVPIADWTAGLAAWRMGDKELAATHFRYLAEAPYVSNSMRAAGAYWAARAYLVTRQPEHVTPMLEIASNSNSAFYGILAAKQLGIDIDRSFNQPTVSRSDIAKQLARPAVSRAVALAQVGRFASAEQEMRRAHGKSKTVDDAALLSLAMHWNMPASQIDIANYSKNQSLRAGLYPLPDFKPKGGFTVDRALVYAFVRQESKFNVGAKSRAGARGLMQLMPRTAAHVSKDRSLRRGNKSKLFDPSFNLMLGQKYIKELMTDYGLQDNLFHLLVAYNGGPGNFRRWKKQMNFQGDPLLYIESIPSRETRGYVEAVFSNLWVYRARLGQAAPSLDLVASGVWPAYVAIEGRDGKPANAAIVTTIQ